MGNLRKKLVCITFPNHCAWIKQQILHPEWEIDCRWKAVLHFSWGLFGLVLYLFFFPCKQIFAESRLQLSCLHGSVRIDILHLGLWWEIIRLSQDTFRADCEIFQGRGKRLFKNGRSWAAERTSVLGNHMTGWHERQCYGWRKECRNSFVAWS